VQQALLWHTWPVGQASLQSTRPPQPSSALHVPVGHCVAGVQQSSLKHTVEPEHVSRQSTEPPQPSSVVALHVVTSSHVWGVQPQTPLSHGPRAQSPSTMQFSPGSHRGQPPPPQSTSVSALFISPSLHSALATHRSPETSRYPSSHSISQASFAHATDPFVTAGHPLQSSREQPTPGAGATQMPPQLFRPTAHGLAGGPLSPGASPSGACASIGGAELVGMVVGIAVVVPEGIGPASPRPASGRTTFSPPSPSSSP
jgi:hypothetical protein